MEPAGFDEFAEGMLSPAERRQLTTLEQALDSMGAPGLRGLLGRVRFRLRIAWRARWMAAVGVAAWLAGVVLVLDELDASLGFAVGGECLMAAGGLLVGGSAGRWWQQRRRRPSPPPAG